MNEIERTEDLLRKAPRLKAPQGLLEKLQAEITLRPVKAHESPGHHWRPLVRRWLPVLSFSTFFLACVVAIAVQSSLLSQLRQENGTLRAGSQSLEQLQQDNSDQQLRSVNQELDQFRTDSAELQRLKSELAQL